MVFVIQAQDREDKALFCSEHSQAALFKMEIVLLTAGNFILPPPPGE